MRGELIFLGFYLIIVTAMCVIMKIEIYPSDYIDGSCLPYGTNKSCLLYTTKGTCTSRKNKVSIPLLTEPPPSHPSISPPVLPPAFLFSSLICPSSLSFSYFKDDM